MFDWFGDAWSLPGPAQDGVAGTVDEIVALPVGLGSCLPFVRCVGVAPVAFDLLDQLRAGLGKEQGGEVLAVGILGL